MHTSAQFYSTNNVRNSYIQHGIHRHVSLIMHQISIFSGSLFDLIDYENTIRENAF